MKIPTHALHALSSLSFLINSVNSFSKFFVLFLSLGDEEIVKECAHQSTWHACLQIPNKDSNLYCHAMLLLRSYEYLCNEWLFQDSSHAYLRFSSLRPDHLFRNHEFVKIFSAQEFQFQRAFF